MNFENGFPSGRLVLARHGVDLIEVNAIRGSIDAHGQLYLDRLFSDAEQDLASGLEDSAQFFAGRFAAKEAIVKCLGTGWRDGVPAPEIEILRRPDGRPWVRLGAQIIQLNECPRDSLWLISISHTDQLAMASAICLPEARLRTLEKLRDSRLATSRSPPLKLDALSDIDTKAY